MSEKTDYVIASEVLEITSYEDKEAVGLRFTDPAGKVAFLWLPGQVLQALANELPRFLADHPETLRWNPPPPPARH